MHAWSDLCLPYRCWRHDSWLEHQIAARHRRAKRLSALCSLQTEFLFCSSHLVIGRKVPSGRCFSYLPICWQHDTILPRELINVPHVYHSPLFNAKQTPRICQRHPWSFKVSRPRRNTVVQVKHLLRSTSDIRVESAALYSKAVSVHDSTCVFMTFSRDLKVTFLKFQKSTISICWWFG